MNFTLVKSYVNKTKLNTNWIFLLFVAEMLPLPHTQARFLFLYPSEKAPFVYELVEGTLIIRYQYRDAFDTDVDWVEFNVP